VQTSEPNGLVGLEEDYDPYGAWSIRSHDDAVARSVNP
jgi:hypothetical protein